MEIITSKDNPIVKQICKLNKSARYRKSTGSFIAEGLRLTRDAVISECGVNYFVFSESSVKKYGSFFKECKDKFEKVYIFSDGVFSRITETSTPQGVLACIKFLDKNSLFDKIRFGGKYIALENLQDPGNMGTVFRTAEAMGIDGIVLAGNCCDVYSPKVVRSTMGAVFRLPFALIGSVKEFLTQFPQLCSYAAVVSGDALRAGSFSFDPNSVCVIGNEANGLSSEAISCCNSVVTIPMRGRAESLNAALAAGILIWEMMKDEQ